MSESLSYSLDNQRYALAFLPKLLEYSDLELSHCYIQDFLTSSGIYTLLPKGSSKKYDLLLYISSMTPKVLEELTQIYMAGPAFSLLRCTWLQAEHYEAAKEQNLRLEFLESIIFDFYETLGADNQGLPIPYNAAPFI